MKLSKFRRISEMAADENFNQFDFEIFKAAYYSFVGPGSLEDRLKWHKLSEEFRKKLSISEPLLSKVDHFDKLGQYLGNIDSLSQHLSGLCYSSFDKKKALTEIECNLVFNSTLNWNSDFKSNVRVKKSGKSAVLAGRISYILSGVPAGDLLIPVVAKKSVEFYRLPANSNGIYFEVQSAIDPSLNLHQLTLKNIILTKDSLVGTMQLSKFRRVLSVGTLLVSALMLGAATRGLIMATYHAKNRIVGGVAIAKHQNISHRLVNMLIGVENLRSLIFYAAETFDADEHTDRMVTTSMAKSAANKTALEVVQDAIQIFGAVGFQWEHPMNFFLRRILLLRSLFGDSIEHLELIADRIVKDQASPELEKYINLAIFASEPKGGKDDSIEVFQ